MLAKPTLVTPNAKVIIFDIDAVIAFYDKSQGGNDKIALLFSNGNDSLEIDYDFDAFSEIYLRYKRGGIRNEDFVVDGNGQPVQGLLNFM